MVIELNQFTKARIHAKRKAPGFYSILISVSSVSSRQTLLIGESIHCRCCCRCCGIAWQSGDWVPPQDAIWKWASASSCLSYGPLPQLVHTLFAGLHLLLWILSHDVHFAPRRPVGRRCPSSVLGSSFSPSSVASGRHCSLCGRLPAPGGDSGNKMAATASATFHFVLLALLGAVLLLQQALPVQCGMVERHLINQLLENYNPLERPVMKETDRLNVNFSVTLQQIIDVDEKNQILISNLWLNIVCYTVRANSILHLVFIEFISEMDRHQLALGPGRVQQHYLYTNLTWSHLDSRYVALQ